MWLPILVDREAKLAWMGTLRRLVLPNWLCDYINSLVFKDPSTVGFQGFVYQAVLRRMEWTVQRPDLLEGLIAGEEAEVSLLSLWRHGSESTMMLDNDTDMAFA